MERRRSQHTITNREKAGRSRCHQKIQNGQYHNQTAPYPIYWYRKSMFILESISPLWIYLQPSSRSKGVSPSIGTGLDHVLPMEGLSEADAIPKRRRPPFLRTGYTHW